MDQIQEIQHNRKWWTAIKTKSHNKVNQFEGPFLLYANTVSSSRNQLILRQRRAHSMILNSLYFQYRPNISKSPGKGKERLDDSIQISTSESQNCLFAQFCQGSVQQCQVSMGFFCKYYFCSFMLPWTKFYVPLQNLLLITLFKKPSCSSIQPPRGLKQCVYICG